MGRRQWTRNSSFGKPYEGEITVAWSPDGSRLALGSTEGMVGIWDAASGRELYVLEGLASWTNMAWAPDGARLATANGETVRIWETASGRELHVLEGHTGLVPTVAWSPDGLQLASGSDEETIRIWDVINGRESQVLDVQEYFMDSITWSPDGTRLAAKVIEVVVTDVVENTQRPTWQLIGDVLVWNVSDWRQLLRRMAWGK